MNCSSCRFHEKDGTCRRFPPTCTVLLMPGRMQGTLTPQPFTSAPMIQNDYWCGEWQANAPAIKLAS